MEEVLSPRRRFLFASPVPVNRRIKLDHFFGKIQLGVFLMIDSKDMPYFRLLGFNLQLLF